MKRRNTTSCCVVNCFLRASDIVLHQFPNPVHQPGLYEDWVTNIGGEVKTLEPSFVFKNRRVCHKHFSPVFYGLKNRLIKSAVPTLHLPDVPGIVPDSCAVDTSNTYMPSTGEVCSNHSSAINLKRSEFKVPQITIRDSVTLNQKVAAETSSERGRVYEGPRKAFKNVSYEDSMSCLSILVQAELDQASFRQPAQCIRGYRGRKSAQKSSTDENSTGTTSIIVKAEEAEEKPPDPEVLAPGPEEGGDRQCSCCLNTVNPGKLVSLWQPQNVDGQLQVYGTMLVDCFGLNWNSVQNPNLKVICQYCIWKLKVGVSFKKEVLAAQAKLNTALPAECSTKVKEEVDNDVESTDNEMRDTNDTDGENCAGVKIKLELPDDTESGCLNSPFVEEQTAEIGTVDDVSVDRTDVAGTNEDPSGVEIKLELPEDTGSGCISSQFVEEQTAEIGTIIDNVSVDRTDVAGTNDPSGVKIKLELPDDTESGCLNSQFVEEQTAAIGTIDDVSVDRTDVAGTNDPSGIEVKLEVPDDTESGCLSSGLGEKQTARSSAVDDVRADRTDAAGMNKDHTSAMNIKKERSPSPETRSATNGVQTMNIKKERSPSPETRSATNGVRNIEELTNFREPGISPVNDSDDLEFEVKLENGEDESEVNITVISVTKAQAGEEEVVQKNEKPSPKAKQKEKEKEQRVSKKRARDRSKKEDAEGSQPKRQATQIEIIPCKVCGSMSSGMHYGVITCEGCKGFFKRTLNTEVEYQCLRNKSCKLYGVKRIRCKFCRLQKCLKLGMSRAAVRVGRMTNEQREKVESEARIYQAQTTDSNSVYDKLQQRHSSSDHKTTIKFVEDTDIREFREL